jgi:hypothetical protein
MEINAHHPFLVLLYLSGGCVKKMADDAHKTHPHDVFVLINAQQNKKKYRRLNFLQSAVQETTTPPTIKIQHHHHLKKTIHTQDINCKVFRNTNQ